MIPTLIGIVLGLAIGFVCRFFDLPLPAPPKLVGAMLVVAMTLGFLFGGVIAAPNDFV
jgi:XapX domain-containing protein